MIQLLLGLKDQRSEKFLLGMHYCCDGKEGLASIPAFTAVELGQLLRGS